MTVLSPALLGQALAGQLSCVKGLSPAAVQARRYAEIGPLAKVRLTYVYLVRRRALSIGHGDRERDECTWRHPVDSLRRSMY